MTYPAITATYSAVLAFIYIVLSSWVVAGRVTHDQLHGHGNDALLKRVRSHANFAEYVPLALLLAALLEAGGASSSLVHGLLVVLVVARILHPIGMMAPRNSPRQFACRGGGILATLGVILVAALALLLR